MSEKEESAYNVIIKLKENKEKIRSEMMEEINNCTSVRTECLLITNYVESLLKDIMVAITVSIKSRKIARDTIVEILKDKNLITAETATDIKKMFDIRDFFGHYMKITEAEKKSEELIKSMDITKKLRAMHPGWDEMELTGKITNIAVFMLNELDEIFDDVSDRVEQ